MKPIKLTICGINSYVSEQCIDFEKLAESNLFGIFGSTGSGKSTILDSIVIALYGTSDRDVLTNIINVNLSDAYIYFEFEHNVDGKVGLIEVRRNFKLRNSGLTSSAYLVNKTKNEVLGDSTDIVNATLEKMLGIGKKEFLKCIALPQNDFDKFLLDTPSERKKSISKLFNLDKFGEEFNKKLKAHLDILSTKKIELDKQLSSFNFVSSDNQLKLLKEIKDDSQREEKLKQDILKLKKESETVKRNYELSSQLDDATKKLDDLKTESEYYENLKNRLNDFEHKKNIDIASTDIKNNISLLDFTADTLDKVFMSFGKIEKAKEDDLKSNYASIISDIKKLKVCNNELISSLEKNKLDKNDLDKRIKNFLDELVSLDISDDNELQKEIMGLKLKVGKTNDDLVNDKNYGKLQKQLGDYQKQVSYFETTIEKLKDIKFVDKTTLDNVLLTMSQKEEELGKVRVRLAINKNTYDNNTLILSKLEDIKEQLNNVNFELELAQKLSAYTSRNALVDYVSEEYLYLISQYANKFVYKLSRGKYMITYSKQNSGEFLAIDNFNGGMTRSIKSLSGGERFIFSLSLALGVSQSISVNKNIFFNFFFIDEGFGNLSEDYLEDVLDCFDSLIKLDFTIGFITHVEKMQEYIVNKVVVTKENNNLGSIIKQY